MKKCPYCGRDNADDAVVCCKCFAGFPNNEPKEERSSDKQSEHSRNMMRKRS